VSAATQQASLQPTAFKNLSRMPSRRVTIAPQPGRDRLPRYALAGIITSARSTRAPLGVLLPECTWNTVRSYLGVSTTTPHRVGFFPRWSRCGRCWSPKIVWTPVPIQRRASPLHPCLEDRVHWAAAPQQQIPTVLPLKERIRIPKHTLLLLFQVQRKT
jgi:hypothetical protein